MAIIKLTSAKPRSEEVELRITISLSLCVALSLSSAPALSAECKTTCSKKVQEICKKSVPSDHHDLCTGAAHFACSKDWANYEQSVLQHNTWCDEIGDRYEALNEQQVLDLQITSILIDFRERLIPKILFLDEKPQSDEAFVAFLIKLELLKVDLYSYRSFLSQYSDRNPTQKAQLIKLISSIDNALERLSFDLLP